MTTSTFLADIGASRRAPLAVALACSALLLVLIARAAVGVPFTDEVQFGYLYNPIARGDLPAWRDLLAAHNGHPYLVLKSLLTLTLVFGLPWSVLMYAQVFALAASFLLVASRSPPGPAGAWFISVAGLGMAILTPRQWENLYWAMQIAFPLALLASLAAFHFAARYADDPSTRNLSWALACSFLASLCNGSGIFAAGLTGIAILVTQWRGSRRHTAGTLIALAAIVALYVVSLRLSTHKAIGDQALSVTSLADHALRMLASSVVDLTQSGPFGLIFGSLLAVLVLWCTLRALRQWREYTFELLCLVFGAILVAGVTYARLRVGIYQPDASRYVPLMMPIVISMVLILYRSRQPALLVLLVATISIGYLWSAGMEWRATPHRHANLQQALDSLCQEGEVIAPQIPSRDATSIRRLFCPDVPRTATLNLEGDHGLLSASLDIPSCSARRIAALNWDASRSNTDSVEIWVNGDGAEKLFAAGNRAGEGTTGAWVAPGNIFILRARGGRELDRLAIPGSACSTAQ